MDALMLLIICLVIIICLVGGLYFYLYNRLQDYLVKINEIESIIDNNLRDKYDNINRCVSIISNEDLITKKDDRNIFEEIVKIRNRKISNFDLDRKLVEANNQFNALKSKYPKFEKLDDVLDITKKIEECDEKLVVNRDFYNKNIAEYNKLVKMFPTNIVAKICKYEEKLFFDRKNMNDDDYEDFKL